MGYEVLARRYRPRNFKTLVGQKHVVKPLINSLKRKQLHHAYLLSGTRGTGKTTIARILAKCFNCETGITPEPCGTCPACVAIDQGNFVDLIEVDAASRTKVEDTRELLDNVQYMPTSGKFKIYLIDEVHMLSGHSFNALLKTLEEPPEHIKFLLATTDPQKLPVTVLSRCLQFHLKELPTTSITKHLEFILTSENIAYEQAALLQIAKSAQGSVRDSLSLLDKAIAYGNESITTSEVNDMLGTIDSTCIDEIIDGLISKDGKKLLTVANAFAESAADFSIVLEELILKLHQIAIAQIVPDYFDQNSPDNLSALEQSKQITKEDLQLYYQIALIGRRDLPLNPDQKAGLEMILLRMLAFEPRRQKDNKTENNKQQTIRTSNKTETHPSATSNMSKTYREEKIEEKDLPKYKNVTKQQQQKTHEQPITATTDTSSQQALWNDLLIKLQPSGMIYALASSCKFKSFSDNNLELTIDKNHSALLNKKLCVRLATTITQHLERQIKLIITPEDNNSHVVAGNDKQKVKQPKTATDKSTDKNIEQLINKFDARLLDSNDRHSKGQDS